ncbi:hypothetical protein G4223_18565 [Magnetospirillum aberrantis SpK]|uniref:Phage tail tape measure protein n=2 Tax=Magnetospirillum TaxID=13134 RepID=A0A7C9QW71_9PROT|nr:hypothetical protein [Magnetospirillum aberrantis SpK]
MIAAVSNTGGAVNSAIGSYYSAKSQASSLKFQADIADINARVAELGAQSELAAGERQVAAQTLRAGQIKGAQRAAMAANGIDLGEGNAAEVLASTDIVKEIDKNTITTNALQSAWGYRLQGTNAQVDALIKRGTAAGISPFGSLTTSLLGSAGRVASSWYDYTKIIENKGGKP